MVVDDSRVIYVQMRKMLDGSDINILRHCRSGEEALEAYGELQPEMVTMDIVMPGMDGIETSRRLLEKWPEAKILMVSSLAYDDTVSAAQEVGAKGFLFKPFDQASLLEAIQTVLICEQLEGEDDTDTEEAFENGLQGASVPDAREERA